MGTGGFKTVDTIESVESTFASPAVHYTRNEADHHHLLQIESNASMLEFRLLMAE